MSRRDPEQAIGRLRTVYDATYVALAEALECTLLTRDRGIAEAPGVQCPVEVI